MKHIFKIFFALQLLFLQHLVAQTNIVVGTAESGSPLRIARDMVDLKPGFKYKPTVGQIGDYKIDQTVVGDASYSAPSFGTDITQRPLGTSNVVGLTQGVASVTGSGGASYTIPIAIPQGTNGMMPSVSINYNSQGGNGLLGMGWDLSAVSAITRNGQTIYHNNQVLGIQMNNSDAFVMDGMRLIPTGGANGVDATVYGTEQESYSKITSNGSSGSGPATFTVLSKNGNTMVYGADAASRFVGTDGTTAQVWYLSSVTDLNGNSMQYLYKMDNGQMVLNQILYTLNGGLPAYNKIQFLYNDRADHSSVYSAGKEVRSNLVMSGIQVYGGGVLFRKYDFTYNYNMYSYLFSVTETGADGSQLNATQFMYGQATSTTQVQSPVIPLNTEYDVYGGDFSGDGISDILSARVKIVTTGATPIRYHDHITIYQGTRNNTYATTPLYDADIPANCELMLPWQGGIDRLNLLNGDFDGNGRSDFILTQKHSSDGVNIVVDQTWIYYSQSNGSFTAKAYGQQINSSNNLAYNTIYPGRNALLTGDFDGDGATDFLTALTNQINGFAAFIYYPRKNIVRQVSGAIGNTSSILPLVNTPLIYVVDYNGDGKSDLMSVNDLTTSIYDFADNGSNAVSSPLYSSGYPTVYHNIWPGDFNGDGKTDLLTINNTGIQELSFSLGTTSGFSTIPFTSFNPDFRNNLLKIGDYNGDGKADIFYGYNIYVNGSSSSSQVDVYYFNGSVFTKKSTAIPTTLNRANFPPSGDFNGDGMGDEILYQSVFAPITTLYFNANSTERLLSKVS